MCACDESLLWMLCSGKYKLLLRSAWIVVSITTLIDICAIVAYWQLATTTDPMSVLRLSQLLLIAVLFLYFFACFLSGFVILQLSGKKREIFRESVTFNSNRTRNRRRARFVPLPHLINSYSDGTRCVLPNNAPIPFRLEDPQRTTSTDPQRTTSTDPQRTTSTDPQRAISTNPQRTTSTDPQRTTSTDFHRITSTDQQNRPAFTRDTTTRLNTRNGKYYTSPKNLNLGDKPDKRQNTQSWATVPQIFVTGPENTAPNYENLAPQTSQSSARNHSNTRSNVAFQNIASNRHCQPGSNSSSVVRTNLKRCQTYQPNVNSRNNTVHQTKPRSESYARRPAPSADAKRILEMSILQAKMDARRANSNPSIGPGVCSNQISNSDTSEQYKRRSITITRSSDSFLAKSEPVVHQTRRYVVDKLPATANPQTQMLFRAISSSEHLFERQSNSQAASNAPTISRLGSEVVNV